MTPSILNEPVNSIQYPAIDAAEFWRRSKEAVVLDVRSPSEYSHAHMPGAINLPLFDDDERAEVGTIYKNSGKQSAVLRGLKFAGQKMVELVSSAQDSTSNNKQVLVHCWRGGMRSRSMTWLLETSGIQATMLIGGYKAFRKLAHESFLHDWKLNVVSGLTGAGKTRVLELLKSAGEQVIDLERLANHRGSAFGGIGQAIQPSTEQFENLLFQQLDVVDREKCIWVEDEGNRIGTVVVPNPFHQLLRNAPAIFLDSQPSQRVENLITDYGGLPSEELAASIGKIRKRLGPQNADEAIDALQNGNTRRAIEIVLAYYDKTYLKAAKSMPRNEMPTLAIDELTDAEIVARAIEISQSQISQTRP